ncbi:MAG TPA: hypothetical protein VFX16_24735 [Pseudonocardiaceae bacterium]|nr:hypothetical protein [Pseudonocardiaceae bacterium]
MLDGGVLDSTSLDRILQAIIFFADSIAVRASYETVAGRGYSGDEIDWKVDALREQGFIRLWAHEYEVDDAGYARDPTNQAGVGRHADLVVVQEDLGNSLSEMDEFMRAVREDAYRDSAEHAGTKLRQGTAEIVGLRSQLASLLISSELNQDGLLTNPATRTTLMNRFRSGMASFRMAVVREVVAQLQVGSLAALTPEQVDQCRRHGQGFRQLLDDSLIAVSRGLDPVMTPQAIAMDLMARYRDISREYFRPAAMSEAADEVLWDLLGAAIPPSIALKYGLKGLRWRKNANELRPFLLLMHLEKSLKGGNQ